MSSYFNYTQVYMLISFLNKEMLRCRCSLKEIAKMHGRVSDGPIVSSLVREGIRDGDRGGGGKHTWQKRATWSTPAWGGPLISDVCRIYSSSTGLQQNIHPRLCEYGVENCILLPAVGKQSTNFTTNLTQPGKIILVRPCTEVGKMACTWFGEICYCCARLVCPDRLG